MADLGDGDRGHDHERQQYRQKPERDEPDPFSDEKRAAMRANWPAFDVPTKAEIEIIAGLRGLSTEGVAIAAERGLLFCASWKGRRMWIVTDSARLIAQGRRLDGKPWTAGKEERKAQSLSGSVGNWPVGIKEAASYRAIALCEGAPDLLSAFHLAWCETSTPETLALGKGSDILGNLGVVAMLGASPDIAEAAVPLFAGKRIRIFSHNDKSGYSGTRKWYDTLKTAGASVDGFSFHGWHQSNGEPVEDLNDFVHLAYDEWENERSLVASAFDFVFAAPKTTR